MGYTATTSMTNTVNNDAEFRAWGSAYAAKWASMGLVQTADTGQINWGTVTKPAAINTVAGYEIWRFNDALQSTYPIFVKIEYGTGASAANAGLWISASSGTNGAGTLTGITTTRTQVVCATATATAINHYWCGDTNRLGVAVLGTTAATSMGAWIERTLDASGAVTSEGLTVVYRASSAWSQQAWNYTTGPYTAAEASLAAMGPSVAPWGVYGTQLSIYPVYHSKGIFMNPGMNVLVFDASSVGQSSIITFTMYGASHTFLTLETPEFGTAGRGGFSSAANATAMMRWE
jgi:hypothetical protein